MQYKTHTHSVTDRKVAAHIVMGQSECFNIVTRQINGLFGNREPWQVASITAISLMTAVWIWEQVKQDESKILIFFFSFLDK